MHMGAIRSSVGSRWSWLVLPDDELLAVRPVAPLPCVYYPEDQGQHHSGRDHHQADVDPLAVPPQAWAVVLVDVCERITDEGAVLQLNEKRAVLVQPLANSYASLHLPVNPRGDTTHRGANLSSLNSGRLTLKSLINLQFMQSYESIIFKPTRCCDHSVQSRRYPRTLYLCCIVQGDLSAGAGAVVQLRCEWVAQKRHQWP